MLLDQDGFECDPVNRSEGDTPLHCAVRYINGLPRSQDNDTFASELVSMMIEAGSDARAQNRARLTPAQLVDPSNPSLRRQLEDATEIVHHANDFVAADEADAEGDDEIPEEYEGSDDDYDPEEFKREVEERRKKAAAAAAATKEGNSGMI